MLVQINDIIFQGLVVLYGFPVSWLLQKWAELQNKIKPEASDSMWVNVLKSPIFLIYNVMVLIHRTVSLALYVPHWLLRTLIIESSTRNSPSEAVYVRSTPKNKISYIEKLYDKANHQFESVLIHKTRNALKYVAFMRFSDASARLSWALKNIDDLIRRPVHKLAILVTKSLGFIDILLSTADGKSQSQVDPWVAFFALCVFWPLVWVNRIAKEVVLSNTPESPKVLHAFNPLGVIGMGAEESAVKYDKHHLKTPFSPYKYIKRAVEFIFRVVRFFLWFGSQFALRPMRYVLEALKNKVSNMSPGISQKILGFLVNILCYAFNCVNGVASMPFELVGLFFDSYSKLKLEWPNRLDYVPLRQAPLQPNWFSGLDQKAVAFMAGVLKDFAEGMSFMMKQIHEPWTFNRNDREVTNRFSLIAKLGQVVFAPLMLLETFFKNVGDKMTRVEKMTHVKEGHSIILNDAPLEISQQWMSRYEPWSPNFAQTYNPLSLFGVPPSEPGNTYDSDSEYSDCNVF